MNYYDININNVITHRDASGKYCPHDIFDRYGIELFYVEDAVIPYNKLKKRYEKWKGDLHVWDC